MSALTAKQRKKLPSGDFAIPPNRYPIHDEAHARNALARVAQHGTPAEQARVKAAVKRRYPQIDIQEAYDPLQPRARRGGKRGGKWIDWSGHGADFAHMSGREIQDEIDQRIKTRSVKGDKELQTLRREIQHPDRTGPGPRTGGKKSPAAGRSGHGDDAPRPLGNVRGGDTFRTGDGQLYRKVTTAGPGKFEVQHVGTGKKSVMSGDHEVVYSAKENDAESTRQSQKTLGPGAVGGMPRRPVGKQSPAAGREPSGDFTANPSKKDITPARRSSAGAATVDRRDIQKGPKKSEYARYVNVRNRVEALGRGGRDGSLEIFGFTVVKHGSQMTLSGKDGSVISVHHRSDTSGVARKIAKLSLQEANVNLQPRRRAGGAGGGRWIDWLGHGVAGRSAEPKPAPRVMLLRDDEYQRRMHRMANPMADVHADYASRMRVAAGGKASPAAGKPGGAGGSPKLKKVGEHEIAGQGSEKTTIYELHHEGRHVGYVTKNTRMRGYSPTNKAYTTHYRKETTWSVTGKTDHDSLDTARHLARPYGFYGTGGQAVAARMAVEHLGKLQSVRLEGREEADAGGKPNMNKYGGRGEFFQAYLAGHRSSGSGSGKASPGAGGMSDDEYQHRLGQYDREQDIRPGRGARARTPAAEMGSDEIERELRMIGVDKPGTSQKALRQDLEPRAAELQRELAARGGKASPSLYNLRRSKERVGERLAATDDKAEAGRLRTRLQAIDKSIALKRATGAGSWNAQLAGGKLSPSSGPTKGAKARWIDSLLAKREGSYSADEQAAYRKELEGRFSGVTDAEFVAAQKKRGKASMPAGSEAYEQMKATAAALGLPWDDAAMQRQFGGAPSAPKAKTAAAPSAPKPVASAIPSWMSTGRGPTGKLRNFKAMNPTKFQITYDSVIGENNDPEAIAAVQAEWSKRNGGASSVVPGLGVAKGTYTPDVGPVTASSAASVGSVAGKRVVVTGKLSTGTRTEVHGKIALAGGKPQPTIGPSTQLLVVGDKPGSKLAKAQALGIPVITEMELMRLLEGLSPRRAMLARRVGELLEASWVGARA